MSDVKVSCPHCNSELNVDSSWDGQVAECPNCKREFCLEIPDQTEQLSPPEMAQPQQPPYAQPQQTYGQQIPPKKNNALKWVLIGCGSIILLLAIIGVVLGIMFSSAMSSAREKGRRIACASNMKQILLASQMYAGDFSEKFPTGRSPSFGNNPWAASLPAPLDLLVTQNYNTDPKTYECPSKPGKCSYLFVEGLNENDSPDLPLLFELPSNHGAGYINVGYVDGSVRATVLPKDCKTPEQIAEHLLKGVEISSARREFYMRNVREAARRLNP